MLMMMMLQAIYLTFFYNNSKYILHQNIATTSTETVTIMLSYIKPTPLCVLFPPHIQMNLHCTQKRALVVARLQLYKNYMRCSSMCLVEDNTRIVVLPYVRAIHTYTQKMVHTRHDTYWYKNKNFKK